MPLFHMTLFHMDVPRTDSISDTLLGLVGAGLIGIAIWHWWPASAPEVPVAPSAEQRRLFRECEKAYDERAINPSPAGDIVTWCNRALQSGLSGSSHKFAIAADGYGMTLMSSPVDWVKAERLETEIDEMRHPNRPKE